jgi:predicted nuclease of predicted toxin-antitoxin system
MRRILIDECINPRLAPRIRVSLPESFVATVRDLGLTGQKDHLLIDVIDGAYDIFLTIDKASSLSTTSSGSRSALSY